MQIDPSQTDKLIERLKRMEFEGGGVLPPAPPLSSGGGGGTYDPMEPRVAKLEAHMENVRAELGKLSSVPADLATLKERVAHLPSKGFVVTAAVGTVGAVVGLLTLFEKIGFLH